MLTTVAIYLAISKSVRSCSVVVWFCGSSVEVFGFLITDYVLQLSSTSTGNNTGDEVDLLYVVYFTYRL